MAQRVSTELIDDREGTPAAETVMFGIDGVNYEIDLSTTNAHTLRALYQQWIPHARRGSPAPVTPTRRRPPP